MRLVAPRPKPYPDYPQTLGLHIKKRRLELGLTQRQAAAELSVNPWTVHNWETCRHQLPITAMPAILAFLGYYPFPEPTNVGERLFKKRRENGWSQRAAAQYLGVDPTTWRDWEAGELILFRKHRTIIAGLLGLDPQAMSDEMRARWNKKHWRRECRES